LPHSPPLEFSALVFTIKSVANQTGNERFYRRSINTCYPFGMFRAMVKKMDEIEAGLKKLEQKIEELEKLQAKGDTLSQEIRDHDSELLVRMAKSAVPVVKIVGLNMLRKGKQDTKGEIYDPAYYPGRMIILGKAVTPAPFRPDNPQMPVTDQFCVMSEEGKFFELMYSFDGFLTDSYLNPIDAKTAIEHYGFDVMFMLYRAMHDYLKGEEALIEALEKVIEFIFNRAP